MDEKLINLFPDITASDIKKYLINETDQKEVAVLDPAKVLTLLNLNFFSMDISEIPPEELALPANDPFRALLHYDERIIATDYQLSEERKRFSIFHEVAHYVLPNHQSDFYLCLDSAISQRTRIDYEIEANKFAADLMYHALDRRAADYQINAKTIKALSQDYRASFESIARRIIEKTMKKCILAVYGRKPQEGLEEEVWDVKYTIASIPFKEDYKADRLKDPMNPIVLSLAKEQFRDIADSIIDESSANMPDGRTLKIKDEYFTNTYNVFRIMTPIDIVD